MEVKVDAAGRVQLPKALRESVGLEPGSVVDVSRYGSGLQLTPGGRTARLVERDGVLVAESDTVVDDEMVFALIDEGRR